MIDWTLFPIPESIDPEDYVIATYLIQSPAGMDTLTRMAAIAVEQTTGTWWPVPEETPEVRRQHVGRIIGMWEIPDYEGELSPEIKIRQFVVQIAYPEVNFGEQIPMLLTTVIGNISGSALKMIDLWLPKRFTAAFTGPKFGIEGVRKLLGVPKRPLLNNMIKPCTGFTPEVGAKLFYEAARAGVDIIKDDELLADPCFCPRQERVKLYMEAVERAKQEKGENTLFTVNVTDRPDKVRDNAYRAIEAGANALMINYLTAGIASLQILAEDPNINVPILAHPDFVGAMTASPVTGVASHVILGKLARLAGADMIIIGAPYGKFAVLRDKYMKLAFALRQPFHHIKPTFPMPGGGVNPGMVSALVADLGYDFIVAAGGAVHGHPMGPAAGARALRQAIDAAMEKVPIRQYAEDKPELQAALAVWGTTEEGQAKKLFDIR